jgi:predicted ATPase/signal transduction histidine kinase
VETVRDDGHTRLVRLVFPGRTVIVKEPLGPDAGQRLRHETTILERLRGVPGVAQLADVPWYPGSIVLADAGRISLVEVAKPLAAADLTVLAMKLAQAVAGMHRREVMHRDITPANIVLSSGGRLCLVDFSLATGFVEIRPEFTHHAEITGSPAYLAPEQTGRTGRPVDQRADLYALGATLYELATGAPPFGTGDPLRLTHDHLARVPASPLRVNPALPAPLSQVIMHLLEKEPDNRYQTADGVVHDLERLRKTGADQRPAGFRVGERDFPPRLLPPSRLVGRDTEITALHGAFQDAMASRCRVVLIRGSPGVGKTALADELRPTVTGRDGWFVAGKFDQYRRDLEFDAVNQAFRALGRLLLAEPEQEVGKVRDRLLEAVGSNTGLLTAMLPEFATLLAVRPAPGDPLTAQARASRAEVEVLRAVASLARPLVLFLDDLQWAGRMPLDFMDLVLGGDQVEGLMLAAAYREEEVGAAHPLAALLSRWRGHAEVRQLRLASLPASGSVALVAEMLRVDLATATALSEAIGPYTSGNPYEIVEMLNALRRDGVLTATAAGWRWDMAAVRGRLGQSDVAGLLAARVEAMPEMSRSMLEAMACLGGRAEVSLLRAATGETLGVTEGLLAPALQNGLLVVEPGAHEAVRFRHDRIREVILAELDPGQRRALQLDIARRLATVPELAAAAAEQYVQVVDAVEGAAERRQAVGLLRRAASQAALIGDYAQVNAFLGAALLLIDPGDIGTLVQVHTGRHAALYSLGRFLEADEEYRTIEWLTPAVTQRAAAVAVQIKSLTQRARFAEALALGIGSLREFGITVPAADELSADLDRQFGYLYRWLGHTEAVDDLTRPDIADPALLEVCQLINALLPASYLVPDPAMQAWLGLEALRIWIVHGPGRTLVGPAATAAYQAVALRGDYSDGYRALQRILALGEARGYEPDTSQARYLCAILSCWFEPIEHSVPAFQQAREGLVAAGDLAWAGYTYYTTVAVLLDCAPSLDTWVTEAEAALAFVRRTGSEVTGQWFDSYRWLASLLRGETTAAAVNTIPIDNPLAALQAHISSAVAAAIFGDQAGLAQHTAAAMPLLPAAQGQYPTAVAHLLRALVVSGQARGMEDGPVRESVLAELDAMTQWLAERAERAPDNFLHLLRLVQAERAWAAGDFRAAVLGFDAARREADGRQRPWHRALIAEQAARFYLAHGADHAGYELLAWSRREYAAWGATAKVAQLDWAYPALAAAGTRGDGVGRPGDGAGRSPAITPTTVDSLGILTASQALSSETSVDRLHAQVVRVLGGMTGATGVSLVLWGQEQGEWLLPAPDGRTVAVGEAVVPLSVLRYVQRTGEPLVVGDAATDDRFARDGYFAAANCCSLLAVPILSRGALRAVLVLENRLIRSAFTVERLDAVKLIAGQLAVSLDNAQLYAELTRSRARIVAAADQARQRIERDLHDGAQQRLVSLALLLRAARAAVPPGLDDLAAQLDRTLAEASDAVDELREIGRGIHPAILAEGGLRPALNALARRSPVRVDLQVRNVGERLPEPIEVSAYYVVAEALTNVAKYARASAVTVEVEVAGDVMGIAVRDDGAGGADFSRGTGLAGLKDRVEALGGRLFLDSPHGTGTTLRVELPLVDANGGVTSA